MGMATEIYKLWVKEMRHTKECQEAEDKGYEEGCGGYLKGFLAMKLNFDWSTLMRT